VGTDAIDAAPAAAAAAADTISFTFLSPDGARCLIATGNSEKASLMRYAVGSG